jgi:hypothetical protein
MVARRPAIGVAVGVVLIAVVETGSSRYLEPTSYRRPASGDNPFDENAAVWYRLAMSRMTDASPALLVPILKGGSEHYLELVDDRILRACREVRAPRVDAAMRSTRCDWEIGSASDPRDGFEYEREALVLGSCLVIDGHRASANRKMDDALNSYLRALSFGCDFGNGDGMMTMIGLSTALGGLRGIERLVMHTDDSRFLNAVSSRLEPYSSRLPTAERPLTRDRLWLENATALGKLQSDGYLANRYAADDLRAAWQLWLVSPMTRSLVALVSIDDYDRALKVAEEKPYREDYGCCPGGSSKAKRNSAHEPLSTDTARDRASTMALRPPRVSARPRGARPVTKHCRLALPSNSGRPGLQTHRCWWDRS